MRGVTGDSNGEFITNYAFLLTRLMRGVTLENAQVVLENAFLLTRLMRGVTRLGLERCR